jgi:hypothetical protein
MFSVRADGSDLAYLRSPLGWTPPPVWSADRDRIAFTYRRGRDFHVKVVRAEGSTQPPGAGGRTTRWSFDGTPVTWDAGHDWPGAVKAERTNARRLETPELDDVFFFFADSPDPSLPANAWLSFDRGSSATPTRGERDPNVDVYLVRADGSVGMRLTGDSSVELYGAWSPDGGRIGFTAIHDGGTDVFVMQADGSDLRRRSDGSSEDFWLGWSPDGRRLAIQSVQDGKNALRVMQAEGNEAREIMATPCYGSFGFAWAPDSRRVAFTNGCSQPAEFWLAAVDWGPAVPLTEAIRAGRDWHSGPPAFMPITPDPHDRGL